MEPHREKSNNVDSDQVRRKPGWTATEGGSRLKFCIKEVEVLYHPSSENKDADQLRGYREADLRPCFRICKTLVFPRGGSMVTNLLIAQPFTKEKNHQGKGPNGNKPAQSPTVPYTKEKITGTRVPPSLRGQSKRNCPSSWPGYPPGLFPAHLRGWGMGYGAWILMAGAIESGGIILFIYQI